MNLAQFETVRNNCNISSRINSTQPTFCGFRQAPNRNCIVAALNAFFVEMERDEIDSRILCTADDIAYHALNEGPAEAFADND